MSGSMESKQELKDQTDENQHSAPLRKQLLGEDESALDKILSKMDAQFLEIKETLYVSAQTCQSGSGSGFYF